MPSAKRMRTEVDSKEADKPTTASVCPKRIRTKADSEEEQALSSRIPPVRAAAVTGHLYTPHACLPAEFVCALRPIAPKLFSSDLENKVRNQMNFNQIKHLATPLFSGRALAPCTP
jgi:hypothetical protein